MWYLPQRNVDLKLDIPPVCTRQPEHGSAFCEEHSSCASKLGFKTSLRGFLKDCGVNGIIGMALIKFFSINRLQTVITSQKRSLRRLIQSWRICTKKGRRKSLFLMHPSTPKTLQFLSKVIVFTIWLLFEKKFMVLTQPKIPSFFYLVSLNGS